MAEDFSDKFMNFEAEYIELKCGINNNLNILLQDDESDANSQNAEQAIQQNMAEAQRYIKMMMVEARSKDFMMKKSMNDKINRYREELNGLKKDFERASLLRKQRLQSLGQTNDFRYRDRMEKATDRLKKSSASLEQSRRVVAETGEIGISVLDNLAQQRESLLSSHEKVRSTREYTGEAHRLLKSMTRRMLANKIILWTTILVLTGCIAIVFYFDFIKSSK